MNIVQTPIKNTGSRAARLRSLLLSDRLEFLMEAHNGLSARIVEQAGFGGVWASWPRHLGPVQGPRRQRGQLDTGTRDARVHG
jgi:hypothetical protein